MKAKTIVIILGVILTCVFPPVGIIVLIVGLCMKKKLTPEEIEQQKREQALEEVERAMLEKNYRFNPVVQEIVETVVKEFSSGESEKLLRYDKVRHVYLTVNSAGIRYRYDWYEKPEDARDVMLSFRILGIEDVSHTKAKVLEKIIFEELKKQCPSLKISGNFIRYQPTIKI